MPPINPPKTGTGIASCPIIVNIDADNVPDTVKCISCNSSVPSISPLAYLLTDFPVAKHVVIIVAGNPVADYDRKVEEVDCCIYVFAAVPTKAVA